MYSRPEAEGIALAASKVAVTEAMQQVFAMFGVNYANFDSREEFRKDIEFLRSLRSGARAAGSRFFMVLVVLVATAFGAGMWEAFKALVLHKP